jgi:hypothetical protein
VEVQGERPLLDRDPLQGGGQVHAVDNLFVDKLEDGIRVLDPVYVGPGPGFERSKESRGGELFQVSLLDGLVGRGQLVNQHRREQQEVVRGGVGEHVDGGHKVPGHTHVVKDGLVLPSFAVFPHVPAVGPIRDARLQVPHVGVRHCVVLGEHEAPAPVPHVKPPCRVQVDIACKDNVVHLGRCRLQLLLDLGQGGHFQGEVRPVTVEAAYQDASTRRSMSTLTGSTLSDVKLDPDRLHRRMH